MEDSLRAEFCEEKGKLYYSTLFYAIISCVRDMHLLILGLFLYVFQVHVPNTSFVYWVS